MSPLRESMVKRWQRFVRTHPNYVHRLLSRSPNKDIFLDFSNRLLNCPDFSNLGRHDIIPELGVLPHHIRSGLARKICVTQGGVYYGKWIHSNLCIIMRSQRGTKGNSMKRLPRQPNAHHVRKLKYRETIRKYLKSGRLYLYWAARGSPMPFILPVYFPYYILKKCSVQCKLSVLVYLPHNF